MFHNASGFLSLSKVASLKGSNAPVDSPSLLETLLDYLPGGSDEVKYRILGVSLGILVLFLGVVVVMVRRFRETKLRNSSRNWARTLTPLELMITPEHDAGLLVSIDEDEELTVEESQLTAVMDDEDESLAAELERKLEEGKATLALSAE